MDAIAAWWQGLIGWLATPDMWTPVTVLTLVISAVAVILAGVAVRQTGQSTLKPLIMGDHRGVEGNDAANYPRWDMHVFNRGNADAQEVRVRLLNTKTKVVTDVYGTETLQVGRHMRAEAFLTAAAVPPALDDMGNYIHGLGPVDTAHLRLVITWREAPNMKKLQRQTYKP
jgi:hypothetical protein